MPSTIKTTIFLPSQMEFSTLDPETRTMGGRQEIRNQMTTSISQGTRTRKKNDGSKI
jgi:hypothetical protein